jgi:hypothetical protein
MHVYNSRFLRRAEVWFDNEPDKTQAVDWIAYHQRSQPVSGAKATEFYTSIIDLRPPTEEIWGRLHDETAYNIRRAGGRDGVVCECLNPNDPTVLSRFEEMYNAFAAARGLLPLEREKFANLAAIGLVDMSVAKNPDGAVLVYHVDYRDRHRARNLYSVSLYRDCASSAARNAIGRANRYLVWTDIMRYKDAGIQCFDFGGWYPGSTDQARLKINEFKRGFGGQIVREYECEQIVSWKGWLVLTAAKLVSAATNRSR